MATSVARRLLARMHATHDKRAISVFAGPPGIGKTTAIDVFCERHPQETAVVKIERQGARELLVLQQVVEALRHTAQSPLRSRVDHLRWARQEIYDTLERLSALQAPPEEVAPSPRLTLVFDEAQNLSRQSIEALRYWNDADRCYAPFRVGFVFIGNSEFALQADASGRSSISAAVADRALFIESLEYADLTDDDLKLFVGSKLDAREDVVSAVVRCFTSRGVTRSLRRVRNFLEELEEVADGGPMTHELVEQVLAYA